MTLFDFNVALGRFADPAGGAFDSVDALLEEMERLRIGGALVYHALAAEGDARAGNRLLLEKVASHPQLHPCWVALPASFGDIPEPRVWVRDAVEAGVRAIRLFPLHSIYPVSGWLFDPLCAELESAELPLLLDFGTQHWSVDNVPWDTIDALCAAHPGLDVVVIGGSVGDTLSVAALMRRHARLHFEIHNYPLPDALRVFAEQGLARQIIFGTGMPKRAGECVAYQTLISGIGEADLRLIGGGNARRVLGLPEADPGMEKLREPARRECGAVIDAHGHYGSWERIAMPVTRPDDIASSMVRCGVHKYIGSHFAAIHGEPSWGNRQTAEIIARYPGMLYGYMGVNPHAPEAVETDLDVCFEEAEGFVGLKFHCYLHKVQLQHPGYERALAYANEHGLPVLVHGGGKDDWEGVCARYPDAAFIIAHGCLWDGVDEAAKMPYALAKDVPNLYVDTAGSPAYRGSLRALVELVGLRKVLYGSDFPLFDFAFEVGRIAMGRFDDFEKVSLLGANALRIFKRLQA